VGNKLGIFDRHWVGGVWEIIFPREEKNILVSLRPNVKIKP